MATQHKDNGWRVCTVTQVEEFKALLMILPIWACTASIYIFFSQATGVAVQQSASLDRNLGNHFQVPSGSVVFFIALAAVLFIPVWEYGFVPVLRKFTGHPRGLTPLCQIGLALFSSIPALVIAIFVEQKRVNTIRNHNVDLITITLGTTPMSVFWLVPQFAILGCTEFLLGTALFKFLYEETPAGMKSMATSLSFASISIGYFTSTGLVNLVNKYTKDTGGWLALEFYSGGLKKYYIVLTIIGAVNFVIFLLLAYFYKYKEIEVARIPKTYPVQDEE
jgi:peptide/histidine transporter 3/4